MLLFVHDIPRGISREELGRFVQTVIRCGWLARLLYHPRVEKADVLKMRTPGSTAWEYHGLVRITPSGAGPMVMELLRKTRLRGCLLEVRAYHRRRLHDRRRAFTDPRLLDFADRRARQRRRDLQCSTTRPGAADPARPSPRGYEWRIRRSARPSDRRDPSGT